MKQDSGGGNMENWIKTNDLKCFKGEFSGFEDIKPINIIIGKNNSGKSTLLELVDRATKRDTRNHEHAVRLGCFPHIINQIMSRHPKPFKDEYDLLGKEIIKQRLKDIRISFMRKKNNENIIHFPNNDESFSKLVGLKLTVPQIWKSLHDRLMDYINDGTNNTNVNYITMGFDVICLKILYNKKIFRIYADRDITQENEFPDETRTVLQSNGIGATNLIRLYLNSEKYERKVIKNQLLKDLNTICNPDAHFSDILCQYSNQNDTKTWEIKLVEDGKGDIPLSASGSGLKTIILVLLFLRAVVEKEDKGNCIFAFEELENNLHPSMQRRLFQFIQDYAVENKSIFFITTHSNIVVDMFANSDIAHITHGIHDRKKSNTRAGRNDIDQKNVLDDIGSKASDLLMSNGIIWVEGPSDRIYFNKWLEIFSPELKEGRHFEFAFFGGSNISSFTASSDDLLTEDKINLMKVNKNAIILVDSDISPGKNDLKPNVKNVSKLSDEMGFMFWATKGREVENYLPGEALCKQFKKDSLLGVQLYQRFFYNDTDNPGYYQMYSGNKSYNKVDFARNVCKHFTKENLSGVLDLKNKIEQAVAEIKKWNEI